jgi:hypothetical protein
MTTEDQCTQEIIAELTKLQKDFKDISQLPILVVQAMVVAGKYRNLSGAQKKECVTKVVVHFIDETDLMDSLLPMIPVLIDQIIVVNNGELAINKDSCSCCFRLFRR